MRRVKGRTLRLFALAVLAAVVVIVPFLPGNSLSCGEADCFPPGPISPSRFVTVAIGLVVAIGLFLVAAFRDVE